eukprot:14289010-Alexandrium_andersonii.AAC.1
MSASLVGSEMCIRDSSQSIPDWWGFPKLCGSSGGSSDGVPAQGCRFAPVSYTHLTLPTICSV